ncbi:hypothetical protein TPB0596_28240 [Tsukamurella pulmonis]|uniref:Uncharacterized protein n=1 Tax=Tsukamurella pulmonis TaxID=47312 RepID=A0A1H1E568_9ACTN|nr:hypothetical protein [Tsukamurella pulmonis]BDD83061.1 hypothetical protein TPB0596_28240 [Tsukamurella pulmonis]SDQ83750.1 hypothetical protein SAMN04489765_2034 [Tsukamurella pulmonis]SUP21310.1 Uncharacterised protein [Tsukamurella pulmonis]
MNVRQWAAGSAVATATVVFLPALAQAAPIAPQQAVLAAHEFPLGSTEYKVERETLTSPEGLPSEPAAQSQCATKLDALSKALDGAAIVEAEAVRGTTELESSVLDRTVTTARSDASKACMQEVTGEDRPTILDAPQDLARLNPFLFAMGRNTLQGWVDVRGVTVIVEAEGKDGGAVETEAFWQTLRAQVAKVERQP